LHITHPSEKMQNLQLVCLVVLSFLYQYCAGPG